MWEIFIHLNIWNTTKNCPRICGNYIFALSAVTAAGPKIISHIRKMWCKSLQTSSQGPKKIPGMLPEVPVVF